MKWVCFNSDIKLIFGLDCLEIILYFFLKFIKYRWTTKMEVEEEDDDKEEDEEEKRRTNNDNLIKIKWIN